MTTKSRTILPIATALAALSGSVAPDPATAAAPKRTEPVLASQEALPDKQGAQPNVLFTAGQDLLGLIVAKQADGTVVAQHSSHVSHASHASHASHHSHFSSR
jgi:hypothetical protein